MDFLTDKQLADLLQVAQARRDNLLIRVLYETGCTVSEVTEIQRVHIKSNSISIDRRTVRISKKLHEEIVSFLTSHSSEFLFCSRQSPSLTPKRVQQIVGKLLHVIDLREMKKTPQLLRYTHIAHAVQRQVPFQAIMAQTGLREQRLSQIVKEVGVPDGDPYGRMFS